VARPSSGHGRKPAGGAWTRRTASAALAALAVTTVVTGSSSAASVGDGPFLVAKPGMSWPCSPQPVFIDVAGAPSATTATTSGADVQLSPALRPGWLYSTVLHELGHVGGLAHVSNSSEVTGLYPSTPHDRYEVGDLVGLRLADRPCTTTAAFGTRG
jgi:hypothetical protein